MLIDFKNLATSEKMQWLQAAISPRPICFASTISLDGIVNLSPFSFFNLFSYNPPIVIFSCTRRMRNNSTKDTFDNILEVPECVINIVDFKMIQQTSLSSCEYSKEVDEFVKAGFTKMPATMVKPPMVKESNIQIECKVFETKSLGEIGGSGQLVIAEILCMHVNESILTENRKIDQQKLNLVARMGGDWYCKVDTSNMFEIVKPNTQLAIGIDQLPKGIRYSKILTGNHLGQLANVQTIPEIDPAFESERLKNIVQYFSITPFEMEVELHKYAAELLNQKRVSDAWQILLAIETEL
jgi:flavin reductase (DIM6/NTAB) family NADH-FMN oxidoreductase RutF